MNDGWNSRVFPNLRDRFAEWFGIDPRSLALFRVSLGLVLLADVCIRACDVRAFYAEGSMFSIAAAARYHGDRWNQSLHWLDGSPGFQYLLLALAAVLAVAMMAGYRTRLATIGSWLLLMSIHNRVPLLLNGGDILLRLLLFWAMFLPLGRVWSVDARRRKQPVDSRRAVLSVACLALMVQVCLMYLFTGAFKYNSEWLRGDSLHYVFSFDAYGRPLGRLMLGAPPILLRVLTWGTLALELIGPCLVLLPWPWLGHVAQRMRDGSAPRWLVLVFDSLAQWGRLVVVVGFVGLHVGIEATMTVGLFSYASIAAWTVFLPGWVWEVGRPGWRDSRPQEPAPPFALPAGFAGWMRLCGRAAGGAVCLVFLGYVILWNIATLQKRGEFYDVMPKQATRVSQLALVGQKWAMFSRPAKNDGWFVARATLYDGQQIDILRGGAPIDLEKPADVAGVFPNHRWRKFFRQLLPKKNRSYRKAVSEYLGRSWNEQAAPQRRVVLVELLYFRETTPTDVDATPQPAVKVELARFKFEQDAAGDSRALAAVPPPAARKQPR